MKHNKLSLLLWAELLLCLLAAAYNFTLAQSLPTILTFPWEPLAALLRAMSLSGFLGNLSAVLLYFAVCSLPALYLLYRLLRKRMRPEDSLLLLLSLLLFTGIYLMINPVYLAELLHPQMLTMGAAALGESAGGFDAFGSLCVGSTLHSVWICYITLRLLRHSSERETPDLLASLRLLLGLLMILMVYSVAGSGLQELLASIRTANKATYCLLILRYLIGSLPALLNMHIIRSCIRLLSALREDRYSEIVIRQSALLAGSSRSCAAIIAIAGFTQNLLQLLLGRYLLSSDYTVNFPLGSLILVFAVMLVSRYLAESRALKADNDMFI